MFESIEKLRSAEKLLSEAVYHSQETAMYKNMLMNLRGLIYTYENSQEIHFKLRIDNHFFYIFPDGNVRAYKSLLTSEEIYMLSIKECDRKTCSRKVRGELEAIEKKRVMGEITIVLNHSGAIRAD